MLDRTMIEEAFDLGDGPHADCFAFYAIRLPENFDKSKLVMAYTEPPAQLQNMDVYERPQDFKAVFYFGPKYLMPHKNCTPITDDPIAFPYHPMTFLDIRRDDVRLRPERRVIFFGSRLHGHDVGDCCERTSLYETRDLIVEDLMRRRPAGTVVAFGHGWGENDTRGVQNWRHDKIEQVNRLDPDFILCCENSIFENYITEKIHDGFATDRVVLYLGEKNIEKWVPRECFINLNPYFDEFTEEFDHDALYERLMSITDEEYSGIVMAARKWREESGLARRYDEGCRRLSRLVIRAITGRNP
jgi:hypothetical protein